MDSINHKHTLLVDLRIMCALLLLVIGAMLFVWRPWDQVGAADKTIQVTGEAIIDETPDEFVFYPSYQFKNADKTAALGELTAKSDAVVAALKKLGVADKNIKTDSNGFDRMIVPAEPATDAAYTLQLTITVDTKDQAQKVQDYLLTTQPSGAVSPQPSFSDTTRKKLEAKARDAATKDARSKADQSAKNLGFSVGKVRSVTDGSGFGVMPLAAEAKDLNTTATSSLSIQPGQNSISYSVTIVYFIK